MPEASDAFGRCAGCGFFSLWYTTDNLHLEVDARSRETLEFTGKLGQAVWNFECVVREADLRAEHAEARNPDNDKRKSLAVVMNKDRHCPKFYAHRTGFTPKEHVAMMLSEQLVKAQEERLAEEKKANEERRIAAAKEAKRQRRRDKRDEVARRKEERKWNIGQAVAIVVLAAILAAVFGVITEPWKERAKQGVQVPTEMPTEAKK